MAHLGDGLDPAAEDELVALLHPLGVFEEGLPAAQVDPLVQRRADLCLTVGAAAFELGGDDAGVVENQNVAGAEQPRQVAHTAILERRVSPAHHEHVRRIARAHRPQRNALGRQNEIEQINLHGARTYLVGARLERGLLRDRRAQHVGRDRRVLDHRRRRGRQIVALDRGLDNKGRARRRLAAVDRIHRFHVLDHAA